MKKYTREQLIFFLKGYHESHRCAPTVDDAGTEGLPGATTYRKRFGSWNNALKSAGISVNRSRYSDSELKENLKLLSRELGRPPRPSDLEGRDWIASYSTYRKRFGAWDGIIKDLRISQSSQPSTDLKRYLRRR